MIYFGSISLNQCPAEPLLPIYLLGERLWQELFVNLTCPKLRDQGNHDSPTLFSIMDCSERVSHPDSQLSGCLPLPLHFHQHQLHRQERGRGRVGGDDVLPLLDDIRARQLRLPDVHRQLLHRHFLRPTGMGGYSLTIGLTSVLV